MPNPVIDIEIILIVLGRRHGRDYGEYGTRLAHDYESAQRWEDWRLLKNLPRHLHVDFAMTCSEASLPTRGEN